MLPRFIIDIYLVIYLHRTTIGFGIVRQTSSICQSLDHFVEYSNGTVQILTIIIILTGPNMSDIDDIQSAELEYDCALKRAMCLADASCPVFQKCA